MNDLASIYVSLACQLGARDPDSLDFYSGPALQNLQDHPATLANLQRDAVALRDQLNRSTDDPDRTSFLKSQTDAIVLRTSELQGKAHPFNEESRTYFGVVAPPDTDAEPRKQTRSQIAQLLRNPKDLADAYARYDAQFVVPPARVPAVMTEALNQCRALTLRHIVLPPGESVDVQYVSHKPWSAFSRYRGHAHSVIQVNMDYPLTLDRLLNLACHEGYPGHHVFNSIRDQTLVQQQHRTEFLVQPTFSPQSYVSEAAASYAPSLALSDPDRRRIERDILGPIAGLKSLDFSRYLRVQRLVAALHTAEPQIARQYLDGDLEFVRAADALERETLMQHAEPALLYLNEFRSYILTYTVGADGVQALVEAGHPSDAERWRRYTALMTNPVATLPSRN